jgi:hypothetical protein
MTNATGPNRPETKTSVRKWTPLHSANVTDLATSQLTPHSVEQNPLTMPHNIRLLTHKASSSARKTHVKPLNHLTSTSAMTYAWRIYLAPPTIIDIDHQIKPKTGVRLAKSLNLAILAVTLFE